MNRAVAATRSLPDRLAAPALARLWPRCWKAMARAGPQSWRSVTIRVPVTDDIERRAVAGLLGRPVRPGTVSAGVLLGELDEIVARVGDGWDLRAAVEAVGGPLPDRLAEAGARASVIDAAVEAATESGPDAGWFRAWLQELAAGGMLARLHGRGELRVVETAARLLAAMPADGVPLPAVATRATGDPKALNTGALPGLVLRGIAAWLGEKRPRTASDRRDLWEAVGVVPDDLASQVLVLNLPVGGGGLGEWLAGARQEGLPFRITLHQLSRSRLDVITAAPVFVCENPAVVRAAADRHRHRSAPLVCTEGRPSVACTRLLGVLVLGGCELRYHGDFDWAGLRIAADILARAKGAPWRFGAADYTAALDTLTATDTSRSRSLRGPSAPSPWEPSLAAAMADNGAVVYEEDVLETLLGDLGPA